MTDELPLLSADEVEDAEPSPATGDARPPGPGLPEALLWTLGTFLVLLGAAVVWGMILAVGLMVQNPERLQQGFGDLEGLLVELPADGRIVALAMPNVLAFLVIIPLGLLRLGRGRLRKLNFAAPSLTQLVILLSAVFPTTIIADALYRPAETAWLEFCEGSEGLQLFNEQTSVMDMIVQFEGASLILLLFFLAFTPAIGEEFVFRGVIGRGLTARWGIFAGVAITSVLFAVLHAYPPHIIAILPVGVMMHVVYLATRSFWAPMLFHFTNNGLAALFLSLGMTDTDEPQPWMVPAAAAYVAVSVALLYHYRTRYVDDDGREVGPGYFTAAAPPPDVPARRVAPFGWIVTPLFGLILVANAALLYYDVAAGDAHPEPAPEQLEEDGGDMPVKTARWRATRLK